MLSLGEWVMLAKERISIDDGIRWLGSVKPKAFVWYGLFLLEISVSALILSIAYEIYSSDTISTIWKISE